MKGPLLITLYGKARESWSKDPIPRDRVTHDAVSKIGYDFGKLNVTKNVAVGVAPDDWVRRFLAETPEGTVLNLACGRDRVFRVDPPGAVRWYDPDIIELR